MRIATLIAVLALLCGTTAMADKVPDAKPWGFDLTGLRNITEVEPNDTCPGQEIACGDVVDAYLGPHDPEDLDYFTFYATAGQVLTIGTDAGPDPDAYDTQLTLYNADCSTELDYDDDAGPGWYSLISGFVAPYDGYYVAMVNPYPYSTLYEGNYILFVTCETPQEPPVNDTCDGAIVIERCTSGLIEGDLTWATDDYNLGYGNDCTGYTSAGLDVTYVMTLLAGDIVSMFYSGNFDETFYIVTDCSDFEATCVIGADDTVGSGEQIDWVVLADGVYYLIADAYGTGNGGPFTIDYSIECPVTPTEPTTWGKVKSMFE
ncbi:MAG: PPC domain-containing protein [Candidatus Eisenbacteria sp.]|nr:PPC domain-containing protein [Candidatus Eisenbacteria bacterium]